MKNWHIHKQTHCFGEIVEIAVVITFFPWSQHNNVSAHFCRSKLLLLFFFLQVAPFCLCRAGLSPLKQFRSTTPVIRCFTSSNLSASTSSVNSSLSWPSIWHVSHISQTKQSLSRQHWLLCFLFLFLRPPVLSAGCRNTLVLCSVYSWTCLDIDWRRKKARDSLSSISSHLIINVLICDKSADEPLQNTLLLWVLLEKPWLQSASWHSIFINV